MSADLPDRLSDLACTVPVPQSAPSEVLRRVRRRRQVRSVVVAGTVLAVAAGGLALVSPGESTRPDSLLIQQSATANPTPPPTSTPTPVLPPDGLAFTLMPLGRGGAVSPPFAVEARSAQRLTLTASGPDTCALTPVSLSLSSDVLVARLGENPEQDKFCRSSAGSVTNQLDLARPLPTGSLTVRVVDAAGTSRTLTVTIPPPGVFPAPRPCPTAGFGQDYSRFVLVKGEFYVDRGVVPDAEVGAEVLRVRCMLDGVGTHQYRPQEGDAAYLPVGTPVYEAVGFDPRFRLLVRDPADGLLHRYESDPVVDGVLFPGVREHVVGLELRRLQGGDKLLGTVTADLDLVVDALFTSPVGLDFGPDDIAPEDDRVSLHLKLDDGTDVTIGYYPEAGITSVGQRLPAEVRAVLGAALP